MLLALLLSISLWLPACVGSTAYANLATLAPRSGHDRAAPVRGRSSPTIACLKCLHHHHAAAGPWWLGGGSLSQRGTPASRWFSMRVSAPRALLSGAVMVAAASAKSAISRLASEEEEEAGGGGGMAGGAEENIKGAMISFIKAYKKEMSPLMPPACRFLPTCSVYGVDAIEKFGPVKGGVLTAWRLMRCNPFAGYGVDHPRWPPPGWFAGEKW